MPRRKEANWRSLCFPQAQEIPTGCFCEGLLVGFLFLCVDTHLRGVDDGVVHLVATEGLVVERVAGRTRGGDGGARPSPTSTDELVATAVFGAARGES